MGDVDRSRIAPMRSLSCWWLAGGNVRPGWSPGEAIKAKGRNGGRVLGNGIVAAVGGRRPNWGNQWLMIIDECTGLRLFKPDGIIDDEVGPLLDGDVQGGGGDDWSRWVNPLSLVSNIGERGAQKIGLKRTIFCCSGKSPTHVKSGVENMVGGWRVIDPDCVSPLCLPGPECAQEGGSPPSSCGLRGCQSKFRTHIT